MHEQKNNTAILPPWLPGVKREVVAGADALKSSFFKFDVILCYCKNESNENHIQLLNPDNRLLFYLYNKQSQTIEPELSRKIRRNVVNY